MKIILKIFIFTFLFAYCSNTNTDWDINTTSIGYSNNQLPIGSELIDFTVNIDSLSFDELYKEENIFSIAIENGTYFVRRVVLNFQLEDAYFVDENESNNFQCWYDFNSIDLDINFKVSFNCTENFPTDNIHSAADGVYYLKTMLLLSATCDYYIWVESMDVTNDCQKQDSKEYIQVENITVPNNALQKYLKEIRLELKR
jgi:hypothetical protein